MACHVILVMGPDGWELDSRYTDKQEALDNLVKRLKESNGKPYTIRGCALWQCVDTQ